VPNLIRETKKRKLSKLRKTERRTEQGVPYTKKQRKKISEPYPTPDSKDSERGRPTSRSCGIPAQGTSSDRYIGHPATQGEATRGLRPHRIPQEARYIYWASHAPKGGNKRTKTPQNSAQSEVRFRRVSPMAGIPVGKRTVGSVSLAAASNPTFTPFHTLTPIDP
jgi:hypothetical protein